MDYRDEDWPYDDSNASDDYMDYLDNDEEDDLPDDIQVSTESPEDEEEVEVEENPTLDDIKDVDIDIDGIDALEEESENEEID